MSLYFTVCQWQKPMYSADFLKCIMKEGFIIVEQVDHIGLSQTLLNVKNKKTEKK
jgi:hypothetical protein